MELTKEALVGARFRTRGKWYSAGQVDAFLEELTVSVDEAQREKTDLWEKIRRLERRLEEEQEENTRLREKCVELENAARFPDRGKWEELERERDQLIQDIRALRRFRETFREAVKKDAEGLLCQAGSLDSEELL